MKIVETIYCKDRAAYGRAIDRLGRMGLCWNSGRTLSSYTPLQISHGRSIALTVGDNGRIRTGNPKHLLLDLVEGRELGTWRIV